MISHILCIEAEGEKERNEEDEKRKVDSRKQGKIWKWDSL